MHQFVTSPRLPDKSEYSKIIKEHEQLKNRTWSQVKDFVRNHKVSMAKKPRKVTTDDNGIDSGKVFK